VQTKELPKEPPKKSRPTDHHCPLTTLRSRQHFGRKCNAPLAVPFLGRLPCQLIGCMVLWSGTKPFPWLTGLRRGLGLAHRRCGKALARSGAQQRDLRELEAPVSA